MTRRKLNVLWLTLFFLLTILLAGCGRSTVEVGMVETTLPGQWQASYETFSGTKTNTFTADEGSLLILDYVVEVEKGTLTLRVESPDDEVLWEAGLEDEAESFVEIPLEQDRRYTLVVEGDATGGSFGLAWEVE